MVQSENYGVEERHPRMVPSNIGTWAESVEPVKGGSERDGIKTGTMLQGESLSDVTTTKTTEPTIGSWPIAVLPQALSPLSSSADRQSSVSNDSASSISITGGNEPFSGADAAIMADAFRKALRKPDFAGPIEDTNDDINPTIGSSAILNRELAEEGRDIRSVSSERGVRIQEA